MKDRAEPQHNGEDRAQQQADHGVELEEVFGHLDTIHLDIVLRDDVESAALDVDTGQGGPTHRVNKEAEDKYQTTHDRVVGLFRVQTAVEDGLREHKHHGRKQQPSFPVQEGPGGDARPNEVDDVRDDGVANHLWVLVLSEPLDRLRQLLVLVDDEVLAEVHDAPLAVLSQPGAPNEAVEQCRQQYRCIHAEPLDNVRVTLEERVNPVVVAVAVRPDRQQVLDDGACGVEAAGLDGPHERGDGLRTHGNAENPTRALAPWGASDGLVQVLAAVCINCPHDERRALVDHTRNNPGDQTEGPLEGLRGVLVPGVLFENTGVCTHKRPAEFCGDAVADVA
mmetsp:Transcript_54878/g.158789  ORF Transcript_54878/g.158789 Transcript_54878/m.158789 type:complete len:337 (-) Transcript_54878:1259-2269(-)